MSLRRSFGETLLKKLQSQLASNQISALFSHFVWSFFLLFFCSPTSFLFSEQIYQLFRQICISHSAQIKKKKTNKRAKELTERRDTKKVHPMRALPHPAALPLLHCISLSLSLAVQSPVQLLPSTRKIIKYKKRTEKREETKKKYKKKVALVVCALHRVLASVEDHPALPRRCNCVPDEPTKISQTLRRPQVI